MQPSLAVAFFCLVSGSAVVHHELERNSDDSTVVTFDHTVIGNLASTKELKSLDIRRSHLFIAKIEVGTPAQAIKCLVDTGTADIWVPSTKCSDCGGAHRFAAIKSKTFIPEAKHTEQGSMPIPVQISYGDGDIVGFLVQDDVTIAKHRFVNQTFIIVEEQELREHKSWDGVCGLGWRQLADGVVPLYKSKPTSGELVFGLLPQGRKSTFLTVGEVPRESLKTSTLAWSRVEPLEGKDRSYWVAAGAVSVSNDAPMRGRLLVDTTTAYILAPRKHFGSMMRALFPGDLFDRSCGSDAAAGNTVVCECSSTMDSEELSGKTLQIHLGGQAFGIDAAQLFQRVPAKGDKLLCMLLVQQAPATAVPNDPLEVLGGLLAPGKLARADGAKVKLQKPLFPGLTKRRRLAAERSVEELWILGGAFLEHFAVLLDFHGKRLGFAVPSSGSAHAGRGGEHLLPGAHDNVELLRGLRSDSESGSRTDGAASFMPSTFVLLLVGGLALASTLGIGVFVAQKVQRRKNLSEGPETLRDE